MPEEQRMGSTRDPLARRASGAVRHLARGLLTSLAHPNAPIGREPSGAPIWPAGIVGSLAHDCDVAVAAVASKSAVASLGIDFEPPLPLPEDIGALVMTSRDEVGTADRSLAGQLIFPAKVAAYKAAYPVDRVILMHEYTAESLATSTARTRSGHEVRPAFCQ